LRPFSFDHAHPYAGGQHRGVDLGAPSGSPVLAPAEGVVSFAGTVPTGGKTVSIQTPFGYTATLVHLGSIGVTRGTLVGEASVVGSVGPSGVVELTEPYVYFGARVTSDPQGYVDPLSLLPPRVMSAPPPVAEAAAPSVADAAGSSEPAVTAPAPEAAPAVEAVASPAAGAAETVPEAAVAAAPAPVASAPSSDLQRSTAASQAQIEPASAAAPVEPRITSGETSTIRPEASPVTSELVAPGPVTFVDQAEATPAPSRATTAAPAAAAAKVRSHGPRVATHGGQDRPAGRAARILRRSFDEPQAQIARTPAPAGLPQPRRHPTRAPPACSPPFGGPGPQ